jgi:hypothetical protein
VVTGGRVADIGIINMRKFAFAGVNDRNAGTGVFFISLMARALQQISSGGRVNNCALTWIYSLD